MSKTKLKIVYVTDGVNTKSFVNTRQGYKYRTIALPKKVQEYGDKNGYDSMSLDHCGDHLIIRGDYELMDLDINGTNNNEHIIAIVSYEWLD